jgi:DNA-binding LacI/PurR family transcriptional regulator
MDRSQVSSSRKTAKVSNRRSKPTILDVAKRAGVSKSLVSMVIRGDDRVSPIRRDAVHEAIAELDYRPNAMARGLVQRTTRIIGVVVSDLRNPFNGDVVSGILNEAAGLGYKALINTSDRRRDLEKDAIESFLELRVDGLVLATSRIEDATIELATSAVPVVVLGRKTSDSLTDSLTVDNEMGAEIAVDHCVELGHHAIAHVAGREGMAARSRRTGYERAMVRHGLTDHMTILDGGFTEAGGYRGGQLLLRQETQPTAVIAANDLCAIGVLNALEEAGLEIPRDVSLVGYDNTSLAALRHVSLTTIHQPGEDMGRKAMDLLFERIHEGRTRPRHEVVAPSLVVRSTTAPPRSEELKM